mmetsp:Transcript_43720/g.81567  ORF Transcript_43720/g.81567 Transcript_43720/m.81567 type:complete len:300 (+) Transcript_43720:77-976(+)
MQSRNGLMFGRAAVVAALLLPVWGLDHRTPVEMTFSLAGAETGAEAAAPSGAPLSLHGLQKPEAAKGAWESWTFNFPSFLAGLTVGVMCTVMALGFLTDRLDGVPVVGEDKERGEAPLQRLQRESFESLHLFAPRCTWLVAMLLVQSLSSLILDSFKGLMQRHMSLAFFLTMLVGLGGNAGGQSVVLTVRRLALGKAVQVSEQLHVGLLLVLVMAPLAFVRAYMQQTPVGESLTVGASAAVITVVATVVGTALPKLLWFFNVDPAHGAVGVQVLMDITGIAIVCGLGYIFLEQPWAKWL